MLYIFHTYIYIFACIYRKKARLIEFKELAHTVTKASKSSEQQAAGRILFRLGDVIPFSLNVFN